VTASATVVGPRPINLARSPLSVNRSSLTDLGAEVATRLRGLIELVEGSVDTVLEARRDHDSTGA